MIIRTNRLVLRPFVTEDFLWFKDVARNEEVKMLLPGVACGDDRMVEEAITLYSKGDFINDFYYVICDKNNNRLGVVIAIRVTSMMVDVSYFLKQEFRHQGYMHEAVAEFIKSARKVNSRYKFRFIISEHNKTSLNVVKSLGATIENAFGRYICYL